MIKHQHEQDSDEGQSDLIHRGDEPRGMVQVSVEKFGELRREAPRLLAGDAMDVAVGPARIVGNRWANCLTWLTNSGTTAKPSSKDQSTTRSATS